MNSSLSLLAVPLLGIQLFYVGNKSKECKKADLAVVEIQYPDYDSKIQGTVFKVVVKNEGKKASKPCTIVAADLDISLEDAMKISEDTLVYDLISENNGRAAYNKKHDDQNVDEAQFDYDKYWELTYEVPALEAKESITLTFELKDYWIYDSNCEIIVHIDPEKKNRDCNQKNNINYFFGWG